MKRVFIIISVLLTLSNCAKNKDTKTEETKPVQPESKTAGSQPRFQVSDVFQQQLSDVFVAYVKLKDGFVATDVSKVKTEAAGLRQAVEKLDVSLLEGAAQHDAKTFLTNIQSVLEKMGSTSDISVQRTSFSVLTDNIYQSIKAFGLGGSVAYYEYCPMAFNNKGGYWLSDQEAIRNPYFGNEMLTCGSVKETLQ